MIPVVGRPRPAFSPITAKAFRRRVLRPVEGVFLFHPRALERLVRCDLDRGLLSRHIPPLSYYLIPRETFLSALENENPDALSVIEGLDLPDWVILLPMPLAAARISTEPSHLLYLYWARRFEAEVARAWQQHRDDNRDVEVYGPRGLRRLASPAALREIREVLEHDRMMVLEQDDAAVARQFVALVTRLRYFAPALRAFWFPAVRNWGVVDGWLAAAGLDLPPPPTPSGPEQRLPLLLTRSRPAHLTAGLGAGPDLPRRLGYQANDPDSLAEDLSVEALPAPQHKPAQVALSPLQRYCLRLARRPQAELARRLRVPDRVAERLGRIATGLLPGLPFPATRRRPRRAPPGRLQRRIRLGAFRRRLLASHAAERQGRVARAIAHGLQASWQYRCLGAVAEPSDDPVTALLDARLERLAVTLARRCRSAWDLDRGLCETLEQLLRGLVLEQAGQGRIGVADRFLDHLEQALDSDRTDTVRPRWLRWLRTLGRRPLWDPLPYHSHLETLRAMDACAAVLPALPWANEPVARYSVPLETARARLVETLHRELTPPLDAAFAAAGMQPQGHRQTVALNKLKAELLDAICRRWHLRFADVRDATARNDLRLQDLRASDALRGDRLSRLDRELAKHLPGVYRRGEVYMKGLHRLSAWLFGTRLGRSITRHLLLPFGISLAGLEIVDHLRVLAAEGPVEARLTNPWSLLSLGLALNALLYTEAGKQTMRRLGRGIETAFTLLVVQGIHTLLTWEPLARLLRTSTVRELSRYLLEPLAIGLTAVLPTLALLLLVLPGDQPVPWHVLLLGYLVGSFLRNIQLGRRILDALMVRLVVFWNQVRHTLISGLFRLVSDFFKRLLDGFEQGLYHLEELLRYRSGEPLGGAILKAVARPPGALLSWLTRFYVTVLVEPQVNPIKHFPVVTVSHKLMLPALPALTSGMLAGLDPILPRVVGVPFVTATILLLPGMFGFLVWELKENWKLFAANRPETVRPVPVGRHGETLRVMLRRGMHAGTVPKAFDRLRRVLREALQSGTDAPVKVRRAETRLLQVHHDIRDFRDRELLASVREHCWTGRLKAVARVDPGSLYIATSSLELSILLHLEPTLIGRAAGPIRVTLSYAVVRGELHGDLQLSGAVEVLPENERRLLSEEIVAFIGRSAAACRQERIERLLWLEAGEYATASTGSSPQL